MMENTFLGIDLGTSSIKLILIDENKQILKQVSRGYELECPYPGWSQINPEIWMEKLEEALSDLMKDEDPSSIACIGVTGQMHTLVLLGEDGRPVCPAMMWNDTRTGALIPSMKKAFGRFPGGRHIAGIVSAGSPAANLYWLKKEEPQTADQVRHFLIGPDYLVYRLTGEYGTDYCEASTSSLYNIEARCWSEEVREWIGLKKEIYPKVRAAAMEAGRLLPELQKKYGFGDSVPVIAGTGDNPASAVSTGSLGQGYPVLSLGTSGVLMVPVTQPDERRKGKTILFSDDDSSFSYLVQGVVQSTGESVTWWTKKILGMEDIQKFSRKCEEAWKKGGVSLTSELLFYPHLKGDKTIYADPNMRGAFLGLSTDTTPEEMFFAVLEGLCFAFRELAQKMKVSFTDEGLKAVGGGAASQMWMQTLADVLGVKIQTMGNMAGSGFGVALLAMSHVAGPGSLKSLTRGIWNTEQTYIPDMTREDYYHEKYEKYLRIRDAMCYVGHAENLLDNQN